MRPESRWPPKQGANPVATGLKRAQSHFIMVRLRGLEPPRRFQRYHLKVVRLPIPPQPQSDPWIWKSREASGGAPIREDADVSEQLPERKRQFGWTTQKPKLAGLTIYRGARKRHPEALPRELRAAKPNPRLNRALASIQNAD
mgnify:CR=1 FL=1